MKRAIITGITGQDGAYLAQHLLSEGYEVLGLVRNIDNFRKDKLEYLGISNDIRYDECNLSDLSSVMSLLSTERPDEIYNLAAQSSVGLSFREPISTMHVNTQSVLNILESIRMSGSSSKFYQASSSEMFGSVNSLPITEESVMHPVSPYAISKASAYWSTRCYRESYGLFVCNGILFNHESFLRGDSFFVKKVVRSAVAIYHKDLDTLKLGDLSVKRDFGYAPDYVKVMHSMLQKDEASDYIICSGESIMLREVVGYVFDKLKIDKSKIIEDQTLLRPNEIPDIWGDNSKAKRELHWDYDKSFYQVLDLLVEEELRNYKKL